MALMQYLVLNFFHVTVDLLSKGGVQNIKIKE